MIEDDPEKRPVHGHDVHEQDLKETEELVAGFKRRRPATHRASGSDFIGYHMSKEGEARGRSGEPSSPRGRAPRNRATVVITQSRRRSGWLVWGAIGAGMIAFGGSIAYLVGGASAAMPPPHPIASAPPPPRPLVSPAERDIPPPPPATPTDEAVQIANAPVVAVPPPAARREPRPPATTAAPEPSPAASATFRKRDDFIRDF